MNKTNETTKKKERIIFTGVCTRAVTGKTKFSETIKNQLTILSEDFPYDKVHAYDNVGAKLTPTWYKEKNGYINLSSIYDIPVKTSNNRKATFAEWLDNGLCVGSKLKVSITEKDGAIYPVAVVVETDGEPFDPFEGM